MGPERSHILEGRLWGFEAKATRGTCTTTSSRNAVRGVARLPSA